MAKIIFKIYVAGLNTKNKELIAKFKETCEAVLGQRPYSVETIDISKNLAEAENQKILATPTIIRVKPAPEKRIIGDFRKNNNSTEALRFLIDDLIPTKHG